MSSSLRNQASTAFKMSGLTLRSDASNHMEEILRSLPSSEREAAIDRLIEAVQKKPLKSSMVSKVILEEALNDCNQEGRENVDDVFNVIDAFSIPKFVYCKTSKKFLPADTVGDGTRSLFCEGSKKSEIYMNRYSLIHQRTARHELFTPAAIGSNPTDAAKKFVLKPVEFLLGSTAKLGEIIVLGMLSQLKEGKWFLEDNTGAVPLDLARAISFFVSIWLFTEFSFVLAEGCYEDGVFHVNAFGFPPPELAKTTRSFFGSVNFFGGCQEINKSSNLLQIERDNEDGMMVILSDVWLDEAKVMDKLQVLFQGYSEVPPICFILCGNFLSKPYGEDHNDRLIEAFNALGDILSAYTDLITQSKFIFVPGPKDPGPGSILPRPGLFSCLTEGITKHIPGAIFASNPCRIQYCTQHICILREDMVLRMGRNCVRFPQDGKIEDHYAKTVVCQSHMTPLPLHVKPTHWDFDHSLWLYPIPDVYVSADSFSTYSKNEAECIVTNPGSFSKNQFTFQVYYPASKQIEDSRIED
ncbi:hypothetical protein CAPTEDRAFT_182971 [Capitella teleta]|uniref:DNA polymerase epsilon subunit n=1 Tax=Capitella teleta TaxID=283909 RepID=R7UWH7_CAPTE|nr:hypothetical protein CAPTEDRAFT_182971 [Capitella teleta]|eukprot:ELU10622.1 hypothetical protein CAPTEDRAFT_182971 [Capitella teleta]